MRNTQIRPNTFPIRRRISRARIGSAEGEAGGEDGEEAGQGVALGKVGIPTVLLIQVGLVGNRVLQLVRRVGLD